MSGARRASHLWINIHAGYYDFLQKERDAAFVLTITKADMITFFHRYFFATPTNPIRRISAHLQSQRISPELISTLLPAITALGVPTDQEAFGAFVATKPSIEAIKEFSTTFLEKAGLSKEIIDEYLLKVDALNSPVVPEGISLIEDPDQFRKLAIPGPHAEAVAEYSDLFPSKM